METRWRVRILFETLRRSGARTEGSSRPPSRPRPPTSSEEQQQERSPSSSSGSSNAKRQGAALRLRAKRQWPRPLPKRSIRAPSTSKSAAAALAPRGKRQRPRSIPERSGSARGSVPKQSNSGCGSIPEGSCSGRGSKIWAALTPQVWISPPYFSRVRPQTASKNSRPSTPFGVRD